MALYIILGIIAIFLIFVIIYGVKFYKGKKCLIESFSNSNVIVFGLKGCGKDLIFNKVINARDVNCYANIPYNKELCTIKQIQDFSISPNTFQEILENNITVIDKKNAENTDYYISDGGNFLPSQYAATLVKLYPSLPAYYSLSRHLTNSNIHINSQYLGRVWDKLREQAGIFIKAVKTTRVFGFLITRFIYYDRYDAALRQVDPYKQSLLNSESKANAEKFAADNGTVKEYMIIQRIKTVYYDSRYFHRLIYGYNSPDSA